MKIEVVDRTQVHARNQALFLAAKCVFRTAAKVEATSTDVAGEVRTKDGQLLAYGWFDDNGKVSFKIPQLPAQMN